MMTVPATLPALEAFGFMARDHKSSLGLVDGGKLVANLSAAHLRGLAPEEFPLLLLPAGEVRRARLWFFCGCAWPGWGEGLAAGGAPAHAFPAPPQGRRRPPPPLPHALPRPARPRSLWPSATAPRA